MVALSSKVSNVVATQMLHIHLLAFMEGKLYGTKENLWKCKITTILGFYKILETILRTDVAPQPALTQQT